MNWRDISSHSSGKVLLFLGDRIHGLMRQLPRTMYAPFSFQKLTNIWIIKAVKGPALCV